MFSRLPPELLERIVDKIYPDERSLAYCSKDIYQVMKPFLWRRLKLCARHIVSYHRENILKNIHCVRDLTLNYDGGDAKKIKTFGIFLIRIVNGMNLSSLLPEDDVSEDHFTQLMSKSPGLQVLHLHYYSVDSRWNSGLPLPNNLKNLQLQQCFLSNTFLESVIKASITTLEILEINVSRNLTSSGFLSISKLMNLKHLTMIETCKDELDVSFVGELRNLEYLYIECLIIVENSHLKIWKCLSKLTELYLSDINGIKTIGDINELKSLQHLELVDLYDDPSSFASKISLLKTLKSLFFDSSFYNNYRHTDFEILSGFNEMASLRRIKINCFEQNKDVFHRVIAGLCRDNKAQEFDQVMKPKWSIAFNKDVTECILHRLPLSTL